MLLCSWAVILGRFLRPALTPTYVTIISRPDAFNFLLFFYSRGGEDYPQGSFFSLETLEAEIKSDEVIGVVDIPGQVLAEGIEVTYAGDPIPGWMQVRV